MKLLKSLLGKVLKFLFLPPPTFQQKNTFVLFAKEKSLGYLTVYSDLKEKGYLCAKISLYTAVWRNDKENQSFMFEQHSITCPETAVKIVFFLVGTFKIKCASWTDGHLEMCSDIC